MTRHKYNIKGVSKSKTYKSCDHVHVRHTSLLAQNVAHRLELEKKRDIRSSRVTTGGRKSTSTVLPPVQWTSAEVRACLVGVQTMHQCHHKHCRQQCGPGYGSKNKMQGRL